MKRSLVMILLASLLAALSIDARDITTRKGKLTPIETAEQTDTVAIANDTIVVAEGEIVLAGYDKPLRSRREAMFVTNHTADTIHALEIDITYLDSQNRMLHQRKIWVKTLLPKGETRRIEFRTWDTTFSFYYKDSTKPKLSKATPYDSRAKATRAVTSPRTPPAPTELQLSSNHSNNLSVE